MIRIYDKSGDFGLEITNTDDLAAVVKKTRDIQGYQTLDRRGRKVFVPWHQIEFFRVEDNSAE